MKIIYFLNAIKHYSVRIIFKPSKANILVTYSSRLLVNSNANIKPAIFKPT